MGEKSTKKEKTATPATPATRWLMKRLYWSIAWLLYCFIALLVCGYCIISRFNLATINQTNANLLLSFWNALPFSLWSRNERENIVYKNQPCYVCARVQHSIWAGRNKWATPGALSLLLLIFNTITKPREHKRWKIKWKKKEKEK